MGIIGGLLGLDAIAKHWEQIAVRALNAHTQQRAGDTYPELQEQRDVTKERWEALKKMPELQPRYVKSFPLGYNNRHERRRLAAEARRKHATA
jgi:hypothetical protein